MIATAGSLFAGWLRPEVGRALCGQPPDLRLAGSLRPQGHAYPVDGGYRVRGDWDFASGITHANRLLCTCTVGENYARLVALKTRYDPTNFFRLNQNIKPTHTAKQSA